MFYLGTHDMPIYHFTKCLMKKDLRYMIIGWDERSKVKEPKELESLWFEIFNSYCEKTSNNETDIYFALINEIDYLKNRFYFLECLVKDLNEANKEMFGVEIIKWGFEFDFKKSVVSQKKNFERQFRGANQTIELKEDEYNRLMKVNDEGEPTSLIKKKIRLERVTGLKIEIKICVVDEWLEIMNEAKEINDEIKKENQRLKNK